MPGDRGMCRRHRLRNRSRKGTVSIELTSITRSFGGNKAVNGVSLDAGPGVLGLLGPNGAGKTSLLRMLATVLSPSSGGLRLLDRDPKNAAQRREIRRRRLGYLPQNLGYYPAFTVVEFVEYFALLKEVPPGSVNKAVGAAVERVNLGAKAKAKLRTLSGGAPGRMGCFLGSPSRRAAPARPPCPGRPSGAAYLRRGPVGLASLPLVAGRRQRGR